MSGFRYRPFRTQPRRLPRMLLGRGAVGPWTPLNLTSLIAWFDPSYGVYSDAGTTLAVANDPVYRWVSRNNPAIYVQQTTLGNRPTYKLGANSKPYISFASGSANHMSMTAAASINLADDESRTFIAYVSPIGIANYPMILSRDPGDELRMGDGAGLQPNYVLVAKETPSGFTVSVGTWACVACRFDNTNGLELLVNGSSKATNTSPATSTDNYDLTIGARSGGSFPLNAKVTDIVMMRAKATDAELSLVKAYSLANQPT